MSASDPRAWSPPPPPPTPPPTAPQGTDLRVILVGRTGLESTLRRDERIELLRVRTPLEAVGELGDPIDSASPTRAAVIVGRDADPGEEAGAFVAALKVLDQNVATLLSGQTRSGPGPLAFDGVVAEDSTPDEIRRAVDDAARLPRPDHIQLKPAPPGGATTVRAPSVAPAPTPVGPGPGTAPANGDVDERLILAALMQGRDILVPALELARARTGDGSLRFVAAAGGAMAPETAPTGDDRAVPVRHGAMLYGMLSTSRSTADLRVEAARLGAWMALADQQAALRSAAMSDDLTGAYNRRYFERYMQTALAQAQRNRQTLTLLVFDIDSFKSFNDRYGHPAGAEILRETVRLLRSVIRPGDKVCRIGGDEFAVIFYEPTGPRDPASKPPEDVTLIARRFQEQVRAARFPKLADGAPGALGISGGIATFPWDGRTTPELLKHADDLALAAKRDGKNAIRIGPSGG
ncbi:MAG: GGDEF domain-containing protein [Phycisphaerales bacterium]